MDRKKYARYFTQKYCVTRMDEPTFLKAGMDFYPEVEKAHANIRGLTRKASIHRNIQKIISCIALVVVVGAFLSLFVPISFLGLGRTSVVPKDSGKVVEVNHYWEALNIRNGKGKVTGTIEGGLKVQLTGRYKTLGFTKFAEIGEDKWISVEGIHGRLYELGQFEIFLVITIPAFFILILIFSRKEEAYHKEIKRIKQNICLKEQYCAEKAEMDAMLMSL